MSRPASASGMDIEGWSGLSVRSKSVSLSQNTRLMTTPSKGTDTAKMLPLEGRDAGRVDAHESPLAHGGRKTCRPLFGGCGVPSRHTARGSRIVPGALPIRRPARDRNRNKAGKRPVQAAWRRVPAPRVAPVFSAEIDGALALLEPVRVHPRISKQDRKPAWRRRAALFGFGNGRLLDTKHVRQFLLQCS